MWSRRRFLVALIGAVGATLAACAAAVRSPSPGTVAPSVRLPSPTPPATAETTSPPTDAGPDLRTKIAGLLLVGFRGTTADEAAPTVAAIRELGLGGVVLFSVDQPTGRARNVESPAQLASLVAGLQDAANGSLVVAIDQEGGQVARLSPSHGFAATTSAADLGASGDREVTRAAARAIATTLRDAGVTLNLAPVVDLARNPSNPIIGAIGRSFGADPATVEAHATAFIEAHHELGVRCAIKHFPGQGSASADTHLGVVDVTAAWTRVELEPFEVLARAGTPDAILTAHIFNATLDPDAPATLSRPTVTGILRDEIGWDGPVISDDLQMRAITDAFGYDEAVARALEAGVDLLLVANQITYDADVVPRTVDLVERFVRSGRLDEARIDEAWRRVGRLRLAG